MEKHSNRVVGYVAKTALAMVFAAVCRGQVATEPPPESPTDTATVKDFVRAALHGDFEAIEAALEDGVDIDAKAPSGLTAWHVARQHGHVELARLLAARGADPSIPAPTPAELADYVLRKSVESEEPGLVVLVSQDGKIVYQRGFGLSDLRRDVKNSTETQFRIGSVTKQFTAAAILKLQEQGKLSVDDKISKYFEDFPRGDEVTVHHLLTHTSGIRSYTSKPMFGLRVLLPIDADKLVGEISEDPFDFDPGEKWEYCNSGYFLLGRIVEIASGASYGDYLRQSFFDPLGMDATGVYSRKHKPSNDSVGYSYVDDKFRRAKNWNMTWAGAAGNLYSTVGDLHRWNEAVFGGQAISDESLEAAFAPGRLNDGSETGYGYGWAISEREGIRQISHNGGLDGYTSHLARYPDQETTVVVLCNSSPSKPGRDPDSLGATLARLFLWQHLKPREARRVAKVDVTKLDAYLGRYDYKPSVMVVTRDGDQMYGQLTGQEKLKIYPATPTKFFLKVVDAQVDFVLNDDGEVTHVVHHQNGRSFEAPKLPDIESLDLTEEYLEKFVGKYDYNAVGTLTVERQAKQLTAQMTGQPAFKIFPISETSFEWRVVAAKIAFELNEAGEVVGAIHYQGGGEIQVSRIKE